MGLRRANSKCNCAVNCRRRLRGRSEAEGGALRSARRDPRCLILAVTLNFSYCNETVTRGTETRVQCLQGTRDEPSQAEIHARS